MRGWQSADGWWFLYASAPTFTCPIGSADRLADLLEQACQEAGMDPTWLLRRLKHGADRKRVNGQLTDRCATCGHKLDRVGFFVEVERPLREGEDEAVRGVVLRFGGDPTRVVKSSYCATKREARQWAYDEFQLHTSMAEEA